MSMYDLDGEDREGAERPYHPLPPSSPARRPRSLFSQRVTWRTALVIVGAIVAFRLWVVQSAIVDGTSMSSTLLPEEWVFVVKPIKPHRFSVIVFRDPQEGVPVVKRVVGMPGDTVGSVPIDVPREGEEVRSRLVVNNTVYAEPYARTTIGGIRPLTVPAGHYFVLGDNRDDSVDSRSYGPIPADSVIGVAEAVIYPLNRIRLIPTEAEPVPDSSGNLTP